MNFITLEDDMFILSNQNKELISYHGKFIGFRNGARFDIVKRKLKITVFIHILPSDRLLD